MSSKTYFNLRRELIHSSRKLSQALRKHDQKLIDVLTARVKMLVASLGAVMSKMELKKILAAAGLALVLNITGPELSAQSFGPPVESPFGLGEIMLGAWIEFADMDGDGDFDALAGGGDGYSYGLILYYENIGNSSQAAFIPPVINPFGIDLTEEESFVMPVAVDIDDDGDLDIMASTYFGIAFLENIGSETQPEFEESVVSPFGIEPISYTFSPSFADLDNDGDLDLLAGSGYDEYTYESLILYYENIGDKNAPQFASPVENPFGISNPGNYFAFPALADLDEDGDLDLLIGDYYEYDSGSYESDFRYYENVGDAFNPQFADSQLNPFGLTGGLYFSYPVFADIDDDGDMDLFVGEISPDDSDRGRFIYFENLGSSGVGVTVNTDRLDIYPNPAVDEINIKSDITMISAELIDAMGRVVRFEGVDRPIDISQLAPGLATLRVFDSTGTAYVTRFVKVE